MEITHHICYCHLYQTKQLEAKLGKIVVLVVLILVLIYMVISLPIWHNKNDNQSFNYSSDCQTYKLKYPGGTKITDETILKLLREFRTDSTVNYFIEFLPSVSIGKESDKKYYTYLNNLLSNYPKLSNIIVLQNEIPDEVIDLFKRENFNFIEDKTKLAVKLGLQLNCFTAMVLDSNFTVQLISRYPLAYKTIKDIVETYGGRDANSILLIDTLELAFRVMNPIPEIEIENIITGEKHYLNKLPKVSTICVVFSAACTKCEIRSFIIELRNLEQKLIDEKYQQILYVFEGTNNIDLIRNHVSQSNLQMPAFVTDHFINVKDRHFTSESGDNQSKIVTWDNDGIIKSCDPFWKYINMYTK